MPELRRRAAAITARQHELEHKRTSLAAERANLARGNRLRHGVEHFAGRVTAVIDQLGPAERQQLLRLLIEDVQVTNWHVKIQLRIPLDDPPDGDRAHRPALPPAPAKSTPPVSTEDRLRSLHAGAWHELSDVDLDIVTGDRAVVRPRDEVAALFGPRAVIVLPKGDSADIVLDSLEEVSIRWHPLRMTSPNICASARVVHGGLPDAELAAAGEANRGRPDEQRLLDALVRDAVGREVPRWGRRWEAVAAVERMRRSLLELRGRRDDLRLDPADPAGAFAAVLAETQTGYDLGPARRALLDRIDPAPDAPAGSLDGR